MLHHKVCLTRSEAQFTNGWWAYNWNLEEIIFALILNLMIWSGHKLAHAMTAQLSWHVQNFDLFGKLFFDIRATYVFTRFGWWAHKSFVSQGHPSADCFMDSMGIEPQIMQSLPLFTIEMKLHVQVSQLVIQGLGWPWGAGLGLSQLPRTGGGRGEASDFIMLTLDVMMISAKP